MDQETQDIYKISVLDDIRNLGELSHPVRSGLLERLLTRKVALKRLHANPDDEFCDPNIGPNYEIVGKYRQDFIRMKMYNMHDTVEPLTIEKISTGGYRILNGHHRWFALRMINAKRFRVKLVNTIPSNRILAEIEKSNNDKCISFDFDEVLNCEGKSVEADKTPGFPFNLFYKERLRKNVGACITELERLGFDVWLYTGSYLSKEHIDGLLRHHGAKITGVMNGMKGKRPNSKVTEAFKKKYKVIVHADNESLVWVNTETKDFDDMKISSGDDWASQVHLKVKEQLGK